MADRKKITLPDLFKKMSDGAPITMITCYDYAMAYLVEKAGIDMVLTGDSLSSASRPSIESAAQLVPSLNFLKSGTNLNQTIFLRGVGTATFSIAGEPSVSTVVDGVVYARVYDIRGRSISSLLAIPAP